MKKTFTYLRTLLVGLMAVTATGTAWADLTEGTTTTVNFDDQTTPFKIHDGNRLGVTYLLQEGSETDYYAKYNCGNRNALPFAAYDFSSAVTKAASVVVSFDFNIPAGISAAAYIALSDKDIHNASTGGYNVNSKNSVWGNNGVILAIGNNRNSGENYCAINGVKNDKLAYNTWYTATITTNVSEKKVSYVITPKGGSDEVTSATDQDYWNTGNGTTANACNQIDISMANTGSIYIDNISITPYTDDSEKYAGYTIKYMFGETELKDAVTTRDEVKVGDHVSLIPADFEAILIDGKKYIYDSDDSDSQAIAEDGSTVITVTFREAATWSWSANSNVGSLSASGTVFENENANVSYPLYILNEGKLWTKPAISSTFNQAFLVDEDNKEYTLTYTETEIDAIYYTEAEDIDGMSIVNSGNAEARSSQRAAGYNTSENVVFTTLPQGKYKLVGVFYSPTSGGGHPTIYAGNRLIVEATTGNSNATTFQGEFVLAKDNNDIAFGKGGGATAAFDYVYIQQLEAPTAEELAEAEAADDAADNRSIGITDAGWATYYTDAALDFSGVNGLTAYTATVSENTVTLNEVYNVAAGTGVVLKGAENTYKIPVIASSDTDKGDLQGSISKDTTADGTQYVLAMNKEGNAQFAPATSGTIEAGKAYLVVAGSGESRLNVVIAGETTGITAIEAQEAQEGIYNLQGQRVAKAQKGLYIVNGKKAIVK